MSDYLPNLIIPLGTQVVLGVDVRNSAGEIAYPRGAVGVIVKQPPDGTHAYRIRLIDNVEVNVKRGEFAIRKHFTQPDAAYDRLAEFNLYDTVIYRCIVGSRAYGLDHDESDVDRRGVYLPPAALHWSLYGVPEQLENDAAQEVYWELQKFIVLALKANPNVLECLYTPLVEHADPLAQELRTNRDAFLSKLIFQTYNGYVLSQFKKMQHYRANHGEIKWKHAMHLIRLLVAGITALKEGYIPVRVEQYRDDLLAIRHGERLWDEVNEWRLALHRQFEAAFATSRLPERPDYETVNALLVKARRSRVE